MTAIYEGAFTAEHARSQREVSDERAAARTGKWYTPLFRWLSKINWTRVALTIVINALGIMILGAIISLFGPAFTTGCVVATGLEVVNKAWQLFGPHGEFHRSAFTK